MTDIHHFDQIFGTNWFLIITKNFPCSGFSIRDRLRDWQLTQLANSNKYQAIAINSIDLPFYPFEIPVFAYTGSNGFVMTVIINDAIEPDTYINIPERLIILI